MKSQTLTVEEFKELNRPNPKNKYRAKKTEHGGIKFDSRKEAQRYAKLLLLQNAGDVIKIELQPRFDIIINGVFCGFYKGDFRITWKSGNVTVEDVKGMKTLPVYRLKKKIIEAAYGFKIIER